MPVTHLEIETTFDVPSGFVLPDLFSLPGVVTVEHQPVDRLHAVYFDTEDLRLLRSSLTLRRRLGGADEGWHLKLPTRSGARLEVHAPIGDDAAPVPKELSALSRSVARAAPLGPVVELRTHRLTHRLISGDGTVLADVAEDGVTADLGAGLTPKVWHEVEVEVVHGDESLLAAAAQLLIEAGAHVAIHQSKLARALVDVIEPTRPTTVPGQRTHQGQRRESGRATAGDIALTYVGVQLDALVRLDPLVRLGTDDAVHKMRVAARRLRSALATFAPIFESRPTRRLREELRWLGEVLAPSRDTEVLRDHLLAQARALPDELLLGPVVARIQSELGQAKADADSGALEALDGVRFVDLLEALVAFRAQPPFTARASAGAREVFAERVGRAAYRVDSADKIYLEAANRPARDEALHEVRKTAKRARYAAEATSDVLGKRAVCLSRRMSALQDVLGTHQDATIASHALREMGVRAHLAGENGFSFGVLLGGERARADTAVAAYPEALRLAREAAAAIPG